MAQFVTGLRIRSVFACFSKMHEQRKKDAAGCDLTFDKGGDKDKFVEIKDAYELLFKIAE